MKAPFPGLAVPQQHRVYAMWRSLNRCGRTAIQGEPGTGKTRMHIALMALFAFVWHARDGVLAQPGRKLPFWVKRLRRAWKANRRTIGDAPRALPLMVVTPMRVVPVWEKEIAAAWPEAEVIVIDDQHDVARWMQRCAQSFAPAVIAIFSQSKTRAFGRAWQPAVIEKTHTVQVPDLDAPGEPVSDGNRVIGIRGPDGRTVMRTERISHFHCPDGGTLQEAEPGSLRRTQRRREPAEEPADADDRREPITSLTWFVDKRRACDHCGAALWTDARLKTTEARFPQLPFAAWSRAARVAANAGGEVPVVRGQPQVRLVDAAGQRGSHPPDSFSPYAYLYRCYPGCVAFVEIDESHNARTKTTDIGHAVHLAQRSAQTYGYGSGTQYGGTLTDFFAYWYRYHPGFWQRLGLGWEDAEQAMRRYGVIQTLTREHESTARRGSGQTDVTITTIPAPGISARLLPYLLAELIFIDVLDVGAYMPPRVEVPVVVDLRQAELQAAVETAAAAACDAEARLAHADHLHTVLVAENNPAPDALVAAQCGLDAAKEAQCHAAAELRRVQQWAAERDLHAHYRQIESALETLSTKRIAAATLAKGTLPGWWAVLPFSADPRFTVTSTKRGDWGDVQRSEKIFEAPVLSADHRYPLERELLRIVRQEVAEARPMLIYVEQNDLRSTARRLEHVLAEFHPWTLPNRVDPEDREDAIIGAVARGRQVLIVPYRRVLEGLNLQCCRTIVWYELALNLFMLDQASRRCWRLGQPYEVRLYFLAYRDTTAHRKLVTLGTRSVAAALFAGGTPDGELARTAGADRTTLARLS